MAIAWVSSSFRNWTEQKGIQPHWFIKIIRNNDTYHFGTIEKVINGNTYLPHILDIGNVVEKANFRALDPIAGGSFDFTLDTRTNLLVDYAKRQWTGSTVELYMGFAHTSQVQHIATAYVTGEEPWDAFSGQWTLNADKLPFDQEKQSEYPAGTDSAVGYTLLAGNGFNGINHTWEFAAKQLFEKLNAPYSNSLVDEWAQTTERFMGTQPFFRQSHAIQPWYTDYSGSAIEDPKVYNLFDYLKKYLISTFSAYFVGVSGSARLVQLAYRPPPNPNLDEINETNILQDSFVVQGSDSSLVKTRIRWQIQGTYQSGIDYWTGFTSTYGDKELIINDHAVGTQDGIIYPMYWWGNVLSGRFTQIKLEVPLTFIVAELYDRVNIRLPERLFLSSTSWQPTTEDARIIEKEILPFQNKVRLTLELPFKKGALSRYDGYWLTI